MQLEDSFLEENTPKKRKMPPRATKKTVDSEQLVVHHTQPLKTYSETKKKVPLEDISAYRKVSLRELGKVGELNLTRKISDGQVIFNF